MNCISAFRRRLSIGLATVALGTLAGSTAHAQTPAEGTPPPPPPPPPAVVEAPPAAPAATLPAPPPTAAETMPATRPDTLPPIDVGAWLRVGSKFQGQSDPEKINDWQMDNSYVELHAGGKIHQKVGVTLNLNANMVNWGGNAPGTAVVVEDAIVSFDFMDEFHVWAGHLLVPVDRANASGPFFMIPWNYPGAALGAVAPPTATSPGGPAFIGPAEGPSGRNNGAVVWGDINGGQLTYLAGVFDNGSAAGHPLVSGRLRLALLDKEPGFWGNASFFGDKDMLSLGLGAQWQKMDMGKDWSEVNGDVLFEKKLGGGSFVTAEGAFYHFNVVDGANDNSYYLLAAYATPTIGVGSLQPSVRYQGATIKGGGGTAPKNVDVGLAYLIKGPALRVLANYSWNEYDADHKANALQLGAQAIFF